MRRLKIPSLLIVGFVLAKVGSAEVLLHDGFAYGDTGETRVAWSMGWGISEGRAVVRDEDLPLNGYGSTPGLIRLDKNSTAVCQTTAEFAETIYGSFRVSNSVITEDSLIGLSICKPDVSEVRINMAQLSVLVKGWRRDSGAAFLEEKKAKSEGGLGIREGEVYLVLFRLSDEMAGTKLSVWILSQEQAEAIGARGLETSFLEGVSVGGGALQASQRTSVTVDSSIQEIITPGSVVCLVSRFGAETVFDEVGISSSSFAEAAGLLPRLESQQPLIDIHHITN